MSTAPEKPVVSFEAERRRRDARRIVYEALPAAVRDDLDRRALDLALAGASGSSLVEPARTLRLADARNELLEREHGAALEAVTSKFG